MQIKKVKYHYTPIFMARIQKTDNTKYLWEYGATGTLIIAGGKAQQFYKIIWQILTKLNIILPYNQQSCKQTFTELIWKLMYIQDPTCECLQQFQS